jgi:hypothetical protein
MPKIVEYIIGEKIGLCVYLGEDEWIPYKYQKNRFADFLCPFCEKKFKSAVAPVKNKRTVSCGCYAKNKNKIIFTTHGLSKSPEWNTWKSMKSRCLNPKNKFYKNYGGRGIKICDEWTNSFDNFFKDMGVRPKNHSLDRINNNGNYCKENCKWSTYEEQQNNKRQNRNIEYNGVVKNLTMWAKNFNVPRSLIAGRLNRGWPIEKIFSNLK